MVASRAGLFTRNRYDDARGELKRVLQELPDHKEANEMMAKIREVDVKSEKKKDVSSNIRSRVGAFPGGTFPSRHPGVSKGVGSGP
jgi:TolA-binding protein